MSLLADALQPIITHGLISLGGRAHGITLSELLIRPGTAYDLTVDDQHQAVILDFRDPAVILEAVASDCCRLASATFQSVCAITPELENKNGLPWALIKLYYGAFYAGHCLIRLLGESCSYFDSRHVARIRETATTLGRPVPFALSAGSYRCVINATSSGMACTQARGSVGGAHEVFWSVFGNLLQSVSGSVLSGPLNRADAQAVFAKLEELRRLISPLKYSWLSDIRNGVQYRHQQGVWFPTEHKAAQRQGLARLAGKWISDPMQLHLATGRGDLHAFVTGCIFIIALCRTILLRIAERSTAVTRPFVEFGPMIVLRQMGAA